MPCGQAGARRARWLVLPKLEHGTPRNSREQLVAQTRAAGAEHKHECSAVRMGLAKGQIVGPLPAGLDV